MNGAWKIAFAVLIATALSVLASTEIAAVRDLSNMTLEELMQIRLPDVRAGEMGSYGSRISEHMGDASAIQVHGYLTVELSVPYDKEDAVSTFDLHHAVLFFRYAENQTVTPEVSIEYEHAGEEFYLPFAFVDTVLGDNLICRAGYFVAPVGAFNEYQYADFLRVTIRKPVLGTEVIPALWSEVGVQLRGKFPFDDSRNLNFAVFVGNGLEQDDSDPDDGVTPEGGSLRDMTQNFRDESDSGKAVGGRLGATLAKGIDVGVSAYTGAYTVDGQQRLSIYDLDFAYQRGRWLLRAEAATAVQETSLGNLDKRAVYVMTAYRATRLLEPYLQLEVSDLDAGPSSRQSSVLAGIAFHPFAGDAASTDVKLEWTTIRYDDDVTEGMAMAQLAVAF